MLAVMTDQPVHLRPVVAGLPAYVPGKRASGAEPAFKLSSNENPLPPLPGVLAAIADAAPEVNRYPDMYAAELCEALARRCRVHPAPAGERFAQLGGVHVRVAVDLGCGVRDGGEHSRQRRERVLVGGELEGGLGATGALARDVRRQTGDHGAEVNRLIGHDGQHATASNLAALIVRGVTAPTAPRAFPPAGPRARMTP